MNEKLEEFYNTVIDIIYWANEQGHLKDSAMDILLENINREKANYT